MGLKTELLLLAVIQVMLSACIHARSEVVVSDVSARESIESESYLMIVFAVSGLLCAVVLVLLCADLCPHRHSPKEYDNNDVFFGDVNISRPPVVDFAMYPPVESAPVVSARPVYFEPLPDIAAVRLRQQQINMAPNAMHLRPKISVAGRGSLDSDSDCDVVDADAVHRREAAQEKLQLDRLIAGIQRANARQQFPRSQLQYIRELGTGWFGKVLQGEGTGILPGHKRTKVVIQMLKEEATQHDQYVFLQEGSCYRLVDSPNVLKLLSQCVEMSPYLAILELCALGDLKSYLRSQRTSVESLDKQGMLLNFVCDMAAGLQALHQSSFVHRDFAARNCLVCNDMTVKVGDYGLSEELYKDDYFIDSNNDALPIRWLAPESIQYLGNSTALLKNITRESNLWSFGIALWEVFTCGALPYGDLSNDQVFRLVITEASVRPSRPDLPVFNMDRLYQLMQMCWNSSPGQRASLRELRIMLLHLRSATREDPDTSSFDQKWNQLMPRRPPDFAAPSPRIDGGLNTVSADVIDIDLGTFSSRMTRPPEFDSDFSELSASTLVHAGNHQPLRPTSYSNPNSVLSGVSDFRVTSAQAVSSPVNEMSLAAELGALGNPFTVEAYGEDRDDDIFERRNGEQMNISHKGAPQRLDVFAEVHSENKYATEYIGDDADSDEVADISEPSYPASLGLPSVVGSHPLTSLEADIAAEEMASSRQSSAMQANKYASYLQTVTTSTFEADDDFVMDIHNGKSSPDENGHGFLPDNAEAFIGDSTQFGRYYQDLSADAIAVNAGENYLGDDTEFAKFYKEKAGDGPGISPEANSAAND